MNQRPEKDEWLMAEVGRGKREPLEMLLRRYATPLLTFIQRLVGSPQRSEELFQETFLAVWAKRKQYRFPRPFKPWLYAIAMNLCRAEFRKSRQRAASTLPLATDGMTDVPASAAPCPADTAIATETASLVMNAVAQLPPQQRLVVVLRVWDGLSYAEIAEMMGRTEATVRSNMHHGLAAMRHYLEPRLA